MAQQDTTKTDSWIPKVERTNFYKLPFALSTQEHSQINRCKRRKNNC